MNKNYLNPIIFGKRLSSLRKLKALTQTELATKIGISQSALTDYERGKLRLHDNLIVKISKILKISSDELLGIQNSYNLEILPSLRFLKRLNKIEKLPEPRKKTILRTIDDLIFASKNKS
jgi:transcriptional regulator with XRE-family HTH domain